MIWLSIVTISLLALAPSLLSLICRQKTSLDHDQTLVLTVHKEQLNTLNNDINIGLIPPDEGTTLQLEIERRILSTENSLSPQQNATFTHSSKMAWCGLILTPFAALALYFINGHPLLPAQPLAPRLAAQQTQDLQEDALIHMLRNTLATLPQTDPNLQKGYLLLGQAEMTRNHYNEAADAYSHALALGFDPEIAARAAEAITQAHHSVTPQALDLFRKALAAAPKSAPWYKSVEARIAQGEHEQNPF